MDKEQKLLELAKLRQETRYDGYNSIADYGCECNYVSPYSKSAHNVNADVFVILQDWSSDENMQGSACEETNRLGYTPSVKTNKQLISFLEKYLELKLKETYATNIFPFIKMGGMSANIPPKDMQKAAKEFTLPMIEIIKPKIAIALGLLTFNALRQSTGLKKVYNKDEAIKNTFNYKGVKIFFQAHPASSTTNDFIKENWEKMKKYLDD